MNSTDEPGIARLMPDVRPDFEWHATAAVWSRSSKSLLFKMDVDIYQSAYLPFVVLAALILAGRWTFGRKRFPARLQLLGFALLLVRASLRYILLQRQSDGQPHDGAFDVLLQLANLSLGAPLGMAFAFPLIVWLLLFRKAFTEAPRPAPSSPLTEIDPGGAHVN